MYREEERGKNSDERGQRNTYQENKVKEKGNLEKRVRCKAKERERSEKKERKRGRLKRKN